MASVDHGKVESGGPTWAGSEWDCLTGDDVPIDHGIGAGAIDGDEVSQDKAGGDEDLNFHGMLLLLRIAVVPFQLTLAVGQSETEGGMAGSF